MLKRICYTADVVYNGLGTARAGGAVVIQQTTDSRNVIAIVDATEARDGFAEADFVEVGFAILPLPADACVDVRGRTLAQVQAHLKTLEPCRVGLVIDDLAVARALLRLTLPNMPAPCGVVYWAADTADVKQLAMTLNELRQLTTHWRVGLWLNTPKLTVVDARRLAQYLQQTDTPLHLDVRAAHNLLSYLKSNLLMAARPALRVQLTEDDNVPALITYIRKCDSLVVHCPTNKSLKHKSSGNKTNMRFPWEAFMAQGVDVALGSGQVGGRLEHLVRHVQTQQQQHASPLALVRAAVKSGHRALSMTPPRFVRGDDATHITFWSGNTPDTSWSDWSDDDVG